MARLMAPMAKRLITLLDSYRTSDGAYQLPTTVSAEALMNLALEISGDELAFFPKRTRSYGRLHAMKAISFRIILWTQTPRLKVFWKSMRLPIPPIGILGMDCPSCRSPIFGCTLALWPAIFCFGGNCLFLKQVMSLR